ncbi:MAG TPA: nuclear transport factor 2 family protein [Acidimicrobiales bacterium]|nr:nuclear transport factor 2 family protein [Acidimicrobiales bacterium]
MTDTTTTGPAIEDVTATVDAYFAMLNEEDPTRRAALAAQAWTEDGYYHDPLLEAKGHDALVDMVAGVHAQFPGQRFTRTSGVDAHHRVIRFGWQLADPAGAVTVAGLDVAIVADDGRLASLAGFFGPLPELA